MTVLIPVFDEQDSLPLYIETIRNVLLTRTDIEFDVLFVDDGSTDNSRELIERICAADTRFRGLRLSRNFGAHIALRSAGYP